MILFLQDKLNYVLSIKTQPSLKNSRGAMQQLHSAQLLYWEVKDKE
jgi:hypothetical protein